MENIFWLDRNAQRPIMRLDNIFPGCSALLDTGALFPVWTKSSDLLEEIGAEFVKSDVLFGGFGGNAVGDLYKITLKLGNIIYPNMHIIACENNNIPGYFIFSATMFKDMVYTIDDCNKKLIINTLDNQICRNLLIQDSDGKLHVLCTCTTE